MNESSGADNGRSQREQAPNLDNLILRPDQDI